MPPSSKVLRVSDRDGLIGTITLRGAQLIGSTPGLQEVADVTLRRTKSAAAAWQALAGKFNGYVVFVPVEEAELTAEEVALAQVKPYERHIRGRVEQVGGYVTRRAAAEADEHGWIPLPDWLRGQGIWTQRGEAAWEAEWLKNEWRRRAALHHASPFTNLMPAAALKPGDRVLDHDGDGSPDEATVTGTERRRGQVHVRTDDGQPVAMRSSDLVPVMSEAISKGLRQKLPGAHRTDLPAPDPLPPGTATARPVMFPDQRRLLEVSVTPRSPIEQQAMARINAHLPLSEEQLSYLSMAVSREARNTRTPGTKAALLRIADRLDAGLSEIQADRPLSNLPPKVTKTTAGDIHAGDVIAWRDINGQMATGTVRAVKAMRHGQLAQLTVEEMPDNMPVDHLFSARTTVYRLPDLPPDKPVPPPGTVSQVEYIMPDQLRVGDTIDWNDEPVVVSSVRMMGMLSVSASFPTRMSSEPVETTFSSYDDGPVIVRLARGAASASQPWTSVLPPDNPEDVQAADLKAGDRVSIKVSYYTSYRGTVMSVRSVRGEGGVQGRSIQLRRDGGATDTVHVYQGDGTLITRLSHSNDLLALLRAQKAKFDEVEQANSIYMTLRRVLAMASASLIQHARAAGVNDLSQAYDLRTDTMSPEEIKVKMSELADVLIRQMNLLSDDEVVRAVSENPLLGVAQVISGHDWADMGTLSALRQQIGDRLRPALLQMVGVVRADLAETMRYAYPVPGEHIGSAMTRALAAARESPPLDPAVANTLNKLAYQFPKKGADGAGKADVPGIPDVLRGDLKQAIDQLYQLLPEDPHNVGKSYVERTLFEPPTLESLLQGEVPRMVASRVWVPDKASDNGPGEMSMNQNAIIHTAGRMLDDELQKRITRRRVQSARANHNQTVDVLNDLATIQQKIDKQTALQDMASRSARDAVVKERGWGSHYALMRTAQTLDEWVKGGGKGALPPNLAVRVKSLTDGKLLRGRAMQDLADAGNASSVKYGEFAAELVKLRLEKLRLQGVRDQLKSTEGTILREEAIKLLQEIRGDVFGGPGLLWQGRVIYSQTPSQPGPDALQAVRWAETNYPQAWLAAARTYSHNGYSVIAGVERGDYTDGTRAVRLSDYGTKVADAPGPGGVATHEIGHIMERAIPGLAAMEQAEIWRRNTSGKPGERTMPAARLMTGYTGEYSHEDRFPLAYSGKTYGAGEDVGELFTTGVESLFAGSTYMDAEFREWMLGTMAMLGRGETPVYTPAAEVERLAKDLDNAADLAKPYKTHGGEIAADLFHKAAAALRNAKGGEAAVLIRQATKLPSGRGSRSLKDLWNDLADRAADMIIEPPAQPPAPPVEAITWDETVKRLRLKWSALRAEGLRPNSIRMVAVKKAIGALLEHDKEAAIVQLNFLATGAEEGQDYRALIEGLDASYSSPALGSPADAGAKYRVRHETPQDSLDKYIDDNGSFTPARTALHTKIISGMVGSHHTQVKPTVVWLGGGPGAGKSTVALNMVHTPDLLVIGADNIAEDLPEYQEMMSAGDLNAAVYAHREAVSVAHSAVEAAEARRLNYLLDGTGNGSYQWMVEAVKRSRRHGYHIAAKYVTVDTDVAVQRAALRAAETGRAVPDSVIREKHARVSQVFQQAIKDGLFDSAELWDNNGDEPVLVAERKPDGPFTVLDKKRWQSFVSKADGLPPLPGYTGATEKEAAAAERGGQTPSHFTHPVDGHAMSKTEIGETYEQLFQAKGAALLKDFPGEYTQVSHLAGGAKNTPLDFTLGNYGGELKTISINSGNLKTAIKKEEIARKLSALAAQDLQPLLVVQVVDQATGQVQVYTFPAFVSRSLVGMQLAGTYTYTLADFIAAQQARGQWKESYGQQ